MGANCKQDCLNLSFPATQGQASEGIAILSARLAKHGLPESKADDVRIALTEAINNVVEHAYAEISPTDIRIDCSLCAKELIVQIFDSGDPMPGLRVPSSQPAPVDTDLENLPEGGFGWYLIHRLSSDIQYERKDGVNLLYLRFNFDTSH